MSIAVDSIKVYINQFIQNFDYIDAIFLAERLYAEGKISIITITLKSSFILVKNDESTYLLARTYYLSGDINKSYWLLRNSSIEHVPLAKLLLAKCCLETDKYVRIDRNSIFYNYYFRLHEAESVLIGNSSSINTLALDDFINDHTDQAAFALQLLAKVCE
jgi:hypothetical protein